MALGERVRKARDNLLLTQEELGEEAEVSTYAISNIENNHVRPRYATIRKLAKVLETNPHYLWTGEDEHSPKNVPPPPSAEGVSLAGVVDDLEKALNKPNTPVEEIARLLNLSGHRNRFLKRTLENLEKPMTDGEREKLELERQRIVDVSMEAMMRITGPGTRYEFGEYPQAQRRYTAVPADEDTETREVS
jgi:transcriptional regulator with XRE-family HTH domain